VANSKLATDNPTAHQDESKHNTNSLVYSTLCADVQVTRALPPQLQSRRNTTGTLITWLVSDTRPVRSSKTLFPAEESTDLALEGKPRKRTWV